MSSEGDRGPAAPGEHPDNWEKRGSATDMGGADARSPAAQRRGKRWLLIALLGLIVLIALMIAEQFLLRELDRRAIWQDEEFKAYLANPIGSRNYDSIVLSDCQYRPIGWIYRYRICIMGGVGYAPDKSKNPEPAFYLVVVGTKGYLSLRPEEGGGREDSATTLIWFLNRKNRIISDQRRGGAKE